ncbi:hypothetical protein N0V85_009115 [Neurospora sp. IMI 360204]|nr:hypothetical protein N0V85_009115 [Neurospora sp. IMI 360204]
MKYSSSVLIAAFCVSVLSASAAKATTLSAITTSATAPGPTQPGLAADCTKFHLVVSGDTCNAIESQYHITASDFNKWNPSVGAECDNLWLGYYVCVGVPCATPTTTSVSPTSPSPQMPSITSTCNKWYLVQSGDNCWSIEHAQGVSASDFLAWNKAVDAQCDNLWLGYYVCVGVECCSSPPLTAAKLASSGPTPQMPNTVSNCKKFHLVVSGDTCWAIEQAAGISASDFANWNPYVDAACDNLWLGYYICIGV